MQEDSGYGVEVIPRGNVTNGLARERTLMVWSWRLRPSEVFCVRYLFLAYRTFSAVNIWDFKLDNS